MRRVPARRSASVQACGLLCGRGGVDLLRDTVGAPEMCPNPHLMVSRANCDPQPRRWFHRTILNGRRSRPTEVAMDPTPVPGLTRTDLQRHDLSIPGRELIQNRVDIAPAPPP